GSGKKALNLVNSCTLTRKVSVSASMPWFNLYSSTTFSQLAETDFDGSSLRLTIVFWLGGRLTVSTFCVVSSQPSGMVMVSSMLMESLVRLVMLTLLYRKSRLLLAISVSFSSLVRYMRWLSWAFAADDDNNRS